MFLFVVGCQQAPEQTVVSGNIGYLERIALLPNSQATISLYDVSIADKKSELITEQTIDLKDKQVPIAFKLTFDADKLKEHGRYAVRAVIKSEQGQLLWTTDTNYPVEANKAEQELGMLRLVKVKSESTQAPSSANAVAYYQCNEFSVQSRMQANQLELAFNNESYTLNRVVAASGEKYQLNAQGQPAIDFWQKGDEAMLTIDGETFNCQVQEQARSGSKLVNTLWQVSQINNQALLENSKVTINFSEQKIYGSAGCNQYTADYQLNAPEIKLSTIAVTKKACMAAELAEQESRFLTLLGEIKQISTDNNTLTLSDGSGNQLIAE